MGEIICDGCGAQIPGEFMQIELDDLSGITYTVIVHKRSDEKCLGPAVAAVLTKILTTSKKGQTP